MEQPQENKLERELTGLLNRYSQENGSDTPDFILAHYLLRSLGVFNKTIAERENWYGRKLNREIEKVEIED